MRRLLLALIILSTSAAAASAQAWAEKLFPEGVTHDFGNVPRGAVLHKRFRMKNIYAARLDLTEVRSSCTCGSVTPSARFLDKDEVFIDVFMDTRKFMGPKTIKVYVSVGPQYVSTAELKVSANCRSDIVYNPGDLNFGVVPRGQKAAARTIDVEYAGPLDWKVLEVVRDDRAAFQASFKELYRRPGQVGYQVEVALKADAPAGDHKEQVYLKTNDPQSPLVPVLVQAVVQAPLTVTPERLALGPIKVGETITRRVQVRGTQRFRILGVEGLGEGITADPTGPPAEVQLLTLRVRAEQAGPLRKQLQIKTDLAADNVVSVTVEGQAGP